jgi:hypothetical protein
MLRDGSKRVFGDADGDPGPFPSPVGFVLVPSVGTIVVQRSSESLVRMSSVRLSNAPEPEFPTGSLVVNDTVRFAVTVEGAARTARVAWLRDWEEPLEGDGFTLSYVVREEDADSTHFISCKVTEALGSADTFFPINVDSGVPELNSESESPEPSPVLAASPIAAPISSPFLAQGALVGVVIASVGLGSCVLVVVIALRTRSHKRVITSKAVGMGSAGSVLDLAASCSDSPSGRLVPSRRRSGSPGPSLLGAVPGQGLQGNPNVRIPGQASSVTMCAGPTRSRPCAEIDCLSVF